MDMFQLGAHLRGDLELERENFGKAFEAYKSAPDFPGTGRRIAQVLEEAKADPREVAQAFIDSYRSGDLAALPWVIERLEELAAPQSEITPFRDELDILFSEGNPQVLGSIARTQIFRGDYEDGLKNLSKAILAGESQSKAMLAYFIINPDVDPKILKNLQKKKYFDLNDWPVSPDYGLQTKNGPSDGSVKFVESLLSQGEDQLFYGANRTLLFLRTITQPANWILNHFEDVTSNPTEYSDFWEDPEYLFFLGREALVKNSIVNLEPLLKRLGDFGVDDLVAEIYEETRAQLDSQTLFGDDDDWSSDYVASPVPPKVEISPLSNAIDYFGKNLQIQDLLQLLERDLLMQYSDSADALVKTALSGDKQSYLPAAQIIEFSARRASQYGNYKTFSFLIQSRGFAKLIEENDDGEAPFLEYLVEHILHTGLNLFERHLFEIYYQKAAPKKIRESIAKAHSKYVEFWELAKGIDKYADEIISGKFENLDSYEKFVKLAYTEYLDFDSDCFIYDDIFYVGIHEAIDLALEKGKGLQNRKFIDFVISIGTFDSHLACKLLYQDLWGAPDNRAEYNSVKQIQRLDNWALDDKRLSEMAHLGECDEQECLGIFTLISLHRKADPKLLSEIFGRSQEIYNFENTEWAIAHNPNTPPEILVQLAHDSSPRWGMIRELVAIVEPLAGFGEKSDYVQSFPAWAVADNPSAPESALTYLRSIRSDSPEWLSDPNPMVAPADVVQAIRSQAQR